MPSLTRLPDGRPIQAALTNMGEAQSIPKIRKRGKAQGWQERAAEYNDKIGAASFLNEIIASLVSRTDLTIERQQDDGDWVVSEDDRYVALLQQFNTSYRNGQQDSVDLRSTHAWHYQCPGEGFILGETSEDDESIWAVYGPWAVEERSDYFIIHEAANDRGRRVDSEAVWRFWLPDRKWRFQARSPMKPVLSDLERIDVLGRREKMEAKSRMTGNGILFFDETAGQKKPTEGDRKASMVDNYIAFGQEALENEDSLAAVMPFPAWGKTPPNYVEVGVRFDEKITAAKGAATKDFAIGMNAPASIVTAGGVAETQHWGAWLADEKFVSYGVAPVSDRVHHLDLTGAVLRPMMRAQNFTEEDIARTRIGYDVTPIVVKPDRSSSSLDYLKAGAIGYTAARREGDFDEDDAPTPEDIALLEQLRLAKDALRPADQSTVEPGPPAQEGAVTAAAKVTPLKRMDDARDELINQIRGAAEDAFVSAMKKAGQKVTVRARNKSAARKAAVKEAAETGKWNKGVLAAAGITEQELLADAFGPLNESTLRWLARYDKKRREELAASLSIDPDEIPHTPEGRDNDASVFLVAFLTALAIGRLRGDATIEPEIEQVIGPIPPELAAASVGIFEGLRSSQLGALDELPTTISTGTHDLEVFYAEFGIKTKWFWVHDEPAVDFPPHVAVQGTAIFSEAEPVGQIPVDALRNSQGFPLTDFYYPGDHEGCACRYARVTEVGSL